MFPTAGKKLVKIEVIPSAVQRVTRNVQAKTVRNRLTPLKLRLKNNANATTTTSSEIRTLVDTAPNLLSLLESVRIAVSVQDSALLYSQICARNFNILLCPLSCPPLRIVGSRLYLYAISVPTFSLSPQPLLLPGKTLWESPYGLLRADVNPHYFRALHNANVQTMRKCIACTFYPL